MKIIFIKFSHQMKYISNIVMLSAKWWQFCSDPNGFVFSVKLFVWRPLLFLNSLQKYVAHIIMAQYHDDIMMDSPQKGQWRRALMFSLICTWTDSWVNNRDTGDFKRLRAHYDVTVMINTPLSRVHPWDVFSYKSALALSWDISWKY